MKYRAILKDDEEKKENKAAVKKLPSWVVLLFLWLGVNCLAYFYISGSNTIYFWDNAT